MKKTSSSPVVAVNDQHGIELEYNSLRAEIIKRIELRQQLVSIALSLAGLFLSFGLTTDLVALIYPPIAAFLAVGWAQNDGAIRNLAGYIREKLETSSIGLNYETYIQGFRKQSKKTGVRRYVVVSHAGVFLSTQVMAICIELLKSWALPFSGLKWGLLLIDVISIGAVLWIARGTKR